jgi:ankyrin repeat protein
MEQPPNRLLRKRALAIQMDERTKKAKDNPEAIITELRQDFYSHFGQNARLFFESAAMGNADAFVEAFAKINDPFIVTKKGRTVLHIAARYGQLDIVNIVLHARPDFPINLQDCIGRTAFSWALESGKVSLARELLIRGGTWKSFVHYHRFPHLTPLHYAAAEGHANMVTFLIEILKMSPDVHDKRDATPLDYASEQGHLAVVRKLLALGAHVIHSESGHMTALHWAAQSGHKEIVCELIGHDADVNARSVRHETPIHAAAAHNKHAAVRLLYDFGADINAQAQSHTTPLHKAVLNDHQETVRVLIELGANTIPPHNQESYLSLALRRKKYAAVRELLRWGIPLQKDDEHSIRESFHDNPLLLAATYGEYKKLPTLITSSTTQKDLNEALVFAAAQEQKTAVLALLKCGAQSEDAFHVVSHILNRANLASNTKETSQQIQSILNQQSLALRTVHYISQNLQKVPGYQGLPLELKARVLAATHQKFEKAVKTGNAELLTQALNEGADPFLEIPQRLPFVIQAACLKDQNRAYVMVKLLLERKPQEPLPSHVIPWLRYLQARPEIYSLFTQRIAR